MSTSHVQFNSENTNPPSARIEDAESEQWFARYKNSKSVGFCVLDRQLRYVFINERLANINGVPASAHIGQPLRLIIPSLADQIEPAAQQVLATGKPTLHVEISGQRPRRAEDGKWFDHFYPILDESGAVTRVGIIVVEDAEHRTNDAALRELQEKLGSETERLQLLLEVNSVISSNWNLTQVFPRISALIRRLLHHEYASFAIYKPDTGLLVREAIDFPLSKGLTSNVQITLTDGPSGRTFQQRASRIFRLEELETFKGETTDRFLAEGIKSMCCVPLIRPSGPFGVLALGSTREDAFHQEEVGLVELVAAQLALAIEASRTAREADSLKKRLEEERKYLEGEVLADGQFSEIIGESTTLKGVLDQVATVASSHANVLILGETGTGKELIARAIHRMSRVKKGPFVKLNCAAIPTGLLESELFGHEKGAFTGAISQKIGRMELADGGTLFLDEVGEIPLELQPKLLRVLQDQEFERLGSNRTIRVKVRLLAATNRDLEESVAQHQFRSDLFYRLSVFPLRIPPLRERSEDIPQLVRHFVRKFSEKVGRQIESVPKETMDALSQWSWPGNVRELENLMERSVILSQGKALQVPLTELQGPPRKVDGQKAENLGDAEREHIVRVLRETRGVISGPNGAARRLGLKRTTLQSKIRRLQISRSDYEDPQH